MDQILFVNAIPAFRSRFLNYGPRATPASNLPKDQDGQMVYLQKDSAIGQWLKLLDRVASVQVPHSSFEHFYIFSLLSSLFWGSQILGRSSLLQRLCQAATLENGSAEDMSMNQIVLTWSLLVLQGARRLLESCLITKPSASRMWVAHWLLGVTFYLALGVAIWIEGAGMSCNPSINAWNSFFR